MVLSYQIKHLLFSHIQKYSCMLERKCVTSWRSLQHRNGVTRFKQVENQSRNHALWKRTCCQYKLRTEIRYFVSTDYSIPLLHTLVWCDQFLWTTKRCNI